MNDVETLPAPGTSRALLLGGVAAVIADAAIYYFGAPPCIAALGPTAGLAANYALRVLAATLIAFVLLRSRAATPETFGLTGRDLLPDLLWTARIGALLLAGAIVIMAVGVGVIRWSRWRVDLGDDVALWPVSLLVAPLAEEFVYRALLVPGLRANYGPKMTVAFSAVIFYALHLGYDRPLWHVHYAAAGAILAGVFLQRPRLWIVALLHAGGNLLVMTDDLLWRVSPSTYQSLLGQGR